GRARRQRLGQHGRHRGRPGRRARPPVLADDDGPAARRGLAPPLTRSEQSFYRQERRELQGRKERRFPLPLARLAFLAVKTSYCLFFNRSILWSILAARSGGGFIERACLQLAIA